MHRNYDLRQTANEWGIKIKYKINFHAYTHTHPHADEKIQLWHNNIDI